MQSRVPAVLAAIHNFISTHNPHDQPISGMMSDTHSARQMYDADFCQDVIAQQMQDDCVVICAVWGIDRDAAFENDDDDDD